MEQRGDPWTYPIPVRAHGHPGVETRAPHTVPATCWAPCPPVAQHPRSAQYGIFPNCSILINSTFKEQSGAGAGSLAVKEVSWGTQQEWGGSAQHAPLSFHGPRGIQSVWIITLMSEKQLMASKLHLLAPCSSRITPRGRGWKASRCSPAMTPKSAPQQ